MDTCFGEKINLQQVAGEAIFSKYHFIRLFKMAYGKTPHQYLTDVRIERAKELIKKGYTIQHVCGAVGFESIGSFTDLFKRRVGLAPSKFQAHQRLRWMEISATPLKYIPNCFAEKMVS
jgi:AraC-like DNA-binding protein